MRDLSETALTLLLAVAGLAFTYWIFSGMLARVVEQAFISLPH